MKASYRYKQLSFLNTHGSYSLIVRNVSKHETFDLSLIQNVHSYVHLKSNEGAVLPRLIGNFKRVSFQHLNTIYTRI